MKRNKLWILVALLCVAHFMVIYLYFESMHGSKEANYLSFAFDELGNLLVIFLIATVFSFLLALIPFKKRSLKVKFEFVFPIVSMVLLLLMVLAMSQVLYVKKVKGIDLRPVSRSN